MQAAFFDLDKTVIARPSMVAFGGTLRREGLISRRLLLRALWAQAIYLVLGADERRLARVKDAALRLSAGWEQRRISAIVLETLAEVVDPIVYDEALELMAAHRAAGRKVFIVSASPEEIVAPLARYLGADEAVATRAVLDEHGRYTGEVELYCYGPEKAVILEHLAARDGIDLAGSYAYSDSATDAPMLRSVGHPVAVNPDRELLRLARAEGWEIRWFSHRVPLRERVSIPPARAVGVGAASTVVTVAFVICVVWASQELRRRWRPEPATGRVDRLSSSLLRRTTRVRGSTRRLGRLGAEVRRGAPSWRRFVRGRPGR